MVANEGKGPALILMVTNQIRAEGEGFCILEEGWS